MSQNECAAKADEAMDAQEELNDLREKAIAMNKKLHKLTDEELAQVVNDNKVKWGSWMDADLNSEL